VNALLFGRPGEERHAVPDKPRTGGIHERQARRLMQLPRSGLKSWLGSTGLPVRRLQSRMSAVGFDTGGVDGRFRPKTESAVRDLQHRASLAVDGIVGPKTWAVVDALEKEGPAS